MIVSFKNQATEDLFKGKSTKQTRKICPTSLMPIASRKLDQLDSVKTLEELKIPPGNRPEALTGDRKGQWSIRVNEQYRICFKWSENGPEHVEFTDYH
jgi:toxin HigB-1